MAKKKKPLTVQELAAMGGKARAKALSKKQRSELARKAVQKRWEKKKVVELPAAESSHQHERGAHRGGADEES